MGLSSDLLAKIPNVLAMPILIGLLSLLRRRHPTLATRSWLLALTFIVIAQLELLVSFHPRNRWILLFPHVLLVVGQILAAITLACHRHASHRNEPIDVPFLILNTLPLLVFSTVYGYYILVPAVYVAICAAAIAVLIATSLWRKKYLQRALVGSLCYAIAGMLAYTLHFRGAQYWLLFCVFVLAIINLRTNLPQRTLGRSTMLASLGVCAAIFIFHPLVFARPYWQPFSLQVWELQKFFLCIGMLLVLLEDQVASTQWLALHDQLTGLPNRRLLDERLEAAIEAARRTGSSLTVFLVDLNGFKAINDTHGHAAGDFVLVEVGHRMDAQLQPGDTLARLGGDEFVIVCPGIPTSSEILRLEARLQHSLSEPIHFAGLKLPIGGTFGCATFPEDVSPKDPNRVAPSLLHIADARMYSRKSARVDNRRNIAIHEGSQAS